MIVLRLPIPLSRTLEVGAEPQITRIELNLLGRRRAACHRELNDSEAILIIRGASQDLTHRAFIAASTIPPFPFAW